MLVDWYKAGNPLIQLSISVVNKPVVFVHKLLNHWRWLTRHGAYRLILDGESYRAPDHCQKYPKRWLRRGKNRPILILFETPISTLLSGAIMPTIGGAILPVGGTSIAHNPNSLVGNLKHQRSKVGLRIWRHPYKAPLYPLICNHVLILNITPFKCAPPDGVVP